MMTKCEHCHKYIFFKEKGHGEGVCNKKKGLKTDERKRRNRL